MRLVSSALEERLLVVVWVALQSWPSVALKRKAAKGSLTPYQTTEDRCRSRLLFSETEAESPVYTLLTQGPRDTEDISVVCRSTPIAPCRLTQITVCSLTCRCRWCALSVSLSPPSPFSVSLPSSLCIYTYTYIYTHICICSLYIHLYIYLHTH